MTTFTTVTADRFLKSYSITVKCIKWERVKITVTDRDLSGGQLHKYYI